jgi:1,4-alpha-glucan branching enzyme
MAVILDIVLAHTAHEHPFNRMYPYEQSPWYGRGTGEPNQFGLPVIDYAKPPANGFVRDVLAYWMGVFRVDGFRFDYLSGIGSDDQGRGLPYLMNVAREIRPDAFFIGECLPENPGLVNPSGLSAVWHTRCRLALQSLLLEGETRPYAWDRFSEAVGAFDPGTQDYRSSEFMVNYVESHDDPRLFAALRAAGFDPATAARKCMLAAAVLLTVPGEPMLFHGQEWGEDAATERRRNPIDWGKAGRSPHADILEHTRRLGRLRRTRPSLRGPHYAVALLDDARRLLVFHRRRGQADQAVVALNFSGERHELAVAFPQPGPWHDALTLEIVQVRQEVRRALEPYSAAIYLSGVS